MSKRSSLATLLLCLSWLASLDRALAQIDLRDLGQGEGWTRVQDGVLRRELRPNEVETIVYGVEGFTWKLQDLRSQLQVLRREFAAHPTPELRRAIVSHRRVIASTLKTIEKARTAGGGGEAKTNPSQCLEAFGSFTYDADAAAKTERQGVWANASVDFFPSPPEGCTTAPSGEVYAYAFAKATVNGAATTATVTDGPRSDTYVSANAEASRNGGLPCESYSYASVTVYEESTSYNPMSYSKATTNESCPSPSPPASPLQVSLTSDQPSTVTLTTVTLNRPSCVQITWTVDISGGTPAYRSKIYRNDVYMTHGTTYSESRCSCSPLQYDPSCGSGSLTIRADVIDNGGQSRSVSHTTTVFQE